MRRTLAATSLLLPVLLAPDPAHACDVDLDFFEAGPPQWDLGVSAESPAPPVVLDAFLYVGVYDAGCGHTNGDGSCHGNTTRYLELEVTPPATAVERYRVVYEDGYETFAEETDARDGTVRAMTSALEPPYLISVEAFDPAGHRSKAVTFRVEEHVDETTGGGACAVGGTPSLSPWLALLALVATRARRRARVSSPA